MTSLPAWLTGRARPPTWLRVVGALGLTAAAAGLTSKRGLVVGLIAAVVYGSIALSTLLSWDRTVGWSQRHPLLDSLVIVPILFLALAYLTNLPTLACLVTGVVVGALLVAVAARQRQRRRRRT